MNYNTRKVLEVAKSWNEKSIKYVPGCPDQTCAFFVRFVFKQALHQAGRMPVAHTRPYYSEHNIRQLGTNADYADGLAGDVVGARINLQQIQPGDLLFFRDTYNDGSFPVGSITHVGIYLGNNLMADSSRGKCRVRNYKVTFPGLLVEARRPLCLGGASNGIGITLNNGELLKSGNVQEIKIKLGNSASAATVPGRFPMPVQSGRIPATNHIARKPQVFLNGKEVPYKYITLDIALPGGGKHIKLFYHDGQTSAFVAGQKTGNIEVTAKLQGGLHVWADGKEIKPASVNIGVS